MNEVEWGEYRIIDIFDVKNTQSILSRDLVFNSGNTPYLCASSENNAVSSYVSYDKKYIDKGDCVFIGGKTFVVSYQKEDFFSNDSHNLALYLKDSKRKTKSIQLFLAACVTMSLKHKYSWGNSISNQKIQNDIVLLPVNNGEIDFDFMESFIAELEAQRVAELSAYLTVSGYDNYELSVEELDALRKYRNGNIPLKEFSFNHIFNNIQQGRRLKKDDQLPGIIPFVMSGVTNTGVIGYISNPIVMFPRNSITVDIFGNTFYRNYNFGAGDDTGVYWNDKVEYTPNTMLYFTAAIQKSVFGKFSYGKKLRSSQSYNF